jgi:hypothetical protein
MYGPSRPMAMPKIIANQFDGQHRRHLQAVGETCWALVGPSRPSQRGLRGSPKAAKWLGSPCDTPRTRPRRRIIWCSRACTRHGPTLLPQSPPGELCNYATTYTIYYISVRFVHGGLPGRPVLAVCFQSTPYPIQPFRAATMAHLSVRDKTARPRTDSPAPRLRQLPPRKTRPWPPDAGSHRVETTTIQRAGVNGSGMSNTNVTPDTARFRKVRCSCPWPDQSVTSQHRRLGVGIR